MLPVEKDDSVQGVVLFFFVLNHDLTASCGWVMRASVLCVQIYWGEVGRLADGDEIGQWVSCLHTAEREAAMFNERRHLTTGRRLRVHMPSISRYIVNISHTYLGES